MSKSTKSTTKVEGEAPDLPTSDQEFIFTDIQSAPAWVDRGWAGYDRGPALQLPVDLSGKAPYTTKVARVGDTVRFVAAKGAHPAHFEVVEGDQTVEDGTATIKPAQASNVSLEDALKTGAITPGELGPDAKAQVAGRSPELRDEVESGKGSAKPQTPPVKAK